jgi:hypothetical protein
VIRRGRAVAALLAAALVAGCSADQEVAAAPVPSVTGVESAAPTPTPTPAPTPTPTATPTPTPTPTPLVAPLTGVEIAEPPPERPVLAVKIDNLGPSRPQTGLDEADVVVVELVESATRFLALFHSTDPGAVGPVRSARRVEADLLPPYSPVLVLSGAAPVIYAALDEAGLYRVADDERRERGFPEGAFSRDPSRRAPHNLYASAPVMWELGAADGLPAPDGTPWPYAQDVPDGGAPAGGVDLDYGGLAGAYGWDWDARAGVWRRNQGGQPHTNPDGQQLGADTVVIARVAVVANAERPFETLGEGELTVLRDGQAFPGTWRKPERGDHFAWLGADGRPLPLKPGRTWIELVPSTGSAALR